MSQTTTRNSVSSTIVACCTAPGKAALALIRLSGPDARFITHQAATLPGATNLTQVASHTISYGFITDDAGAHIDQVLFLVMNAPKTFTGEEVVEITCHNNPFIIDAILERLVSLGAVPARPGQFTQRAVENDKIDLLQAEGLHDLITAPSRASAKVSLSQLEGSLSAVMTEVEHNLVGLASLVEASFEFSEEEHIDLDFDRLVRERLNSEIVRIEGILASQHTVTQLREGVRIALIGSVNAGKSTLMNALLGRKRAIVSDQAGTTRDSIEASMSNGQHSWTFIDTAGLRETDDTIEQEGIVRTRDAAQGADIVCIVIDGSRALDTVEQREYDQLAQEYAEKALIIQTKAELSADPLLVNTGLSLFIVSAQTGIGMDALQQEITERVTQLYTAAETPFVLNQRHLALLEHVLQALRGIVGMDSGVYELVAARLHEALALLTEMTGHTVTKQVMDNVFSTFCIGK